MQFYTKNLLPDEQRQYTALMGEYLRKAADASDARTRFGQHSREYAAAEVVATNVWCRLRPYEAKIGKAWSRA